jgi:hypothetical protein
MEEVEVAGIPVPRTTYTPGDTYTAIYSPTEIAPPNGTKLPIVKIISPMNKQVVSSKNLTFVFNLTLEASTSTYPITLDALYYKPSWQSDNITIEVDSHAPYMNKTLPFSINLAGIPEGNQSIVVYAYTVCEYETRRELLRQPVSQSGFIVGNFLYIDSNFYVMAGSSSVNFTIDTSSPVIPPENDPDTDFTSTVLLVLGITAVGAILFLACLKCRKDKG